MGVQTFPAALLDNAVVRTLRYYDSSDDTRAFQNFAEDLANATSDAVGGSSIKVAPKYLILGEGQFVLEESINLQSINAFGWGIDGQGAVIDVRCTGKTAFDMLGSRWGNLRNFTLQGHQDYAPAIGIQLGRFAVGVAADCHTLDNIKASGFFTRSPVYNLASETVSYSHCTLYNEYSPADWTQAGCVIVDGYNLLGAITDFTAPSISPNTLMSCLQNSFHVLDARMRTSGCPIHMIDANQFSFLASYAVSYDQCAARFYTANTSGIRNIVFDVHSEPNQVIPRTIQFDRATSGAFTVRGFTYKENKVNCTQSVFKCGTNTTSAKLLDADIQIDGMNGAGPAVGIFEGAFQVAGKLYTSGVPLGDVTLLTGLLNSAGDTIENLPAGGYSIIDLNGTQTLKGPQKFAGSQSAVTQTNLDAARNVYIDDGLFYLRTDTGGGSIAQIISVGDVSSTTRAGAIYYDHSNDQWLVSGGSSTSFRIKSDGSIGCDPLTADPASPSNGYIWYRSDLGRFRVRLAGVTREIVAPRYSVVSADADQTITASSARTTRFTGALTATRSVSFTTTDMIAGQQFQFVHAGSDGNWSIGSTPSRVLNPGDSLLCEYNGSAIVAILKGVY